MLKNRNRRNGNSFRLNILGFRELGVVFLIFSVLLISFFFQPRILSRMSIRNMLQWFPIIAIVAMGEMMIIITRGIDVSIGSNLCFSGLAVGLLFIRYPTMNPVLGVILSMIFGLIMGLVNGIIVAYFHIPSVVTTLAGMTAYRGMAFLLADGSEVSAHEVPDFIMNISRLGPFNQGFITYLFVLMLIAALVTFIIMNFTRMGRNVIVLGSNPDAALIRGVPINKIILFIYGYTGMLAGLAGILYLSRFGFVNPGQTGINFEMTVISAVVIGGVSVYGGSGNVIGVLLGALFLGVVNIALSTLGLPHLWQDAIYGFFIVITVMLDKIIKNLSSR